MAYIDLLKGTTIAQRYKYIICKRNRWNYI